MILERDRCLAPLQKNRPELERKRARKITQDLLDLCWRFGRAPVCFDYPGVYLSGGPARASECVGGGRTEVAMIISLFLERTDFQCDCSLHSCTFPVNTHHLFVVNLFSLNCSLPDRLLWTTDVPTHYPTDYKHIILPFDAIQDSTDERHRGESRFHTAASIEPNRPASRPSLESDSSSMRIVWNLMRSFV
jgi:hypothetical protein